MNDYKYVRNELEDTYGILRLQDKILEIMVYIDGFCKEHEITYYLMGGSALGAMRHGGFIPWDDDLDIFMDYKNYQKFIYCCENYLDTEKYYFQREDSDELPFFFSKLRMNGTTCIESTDIKNSHEGVFVDIMCLNNAAKSNFGRKIQYYAAGMLKAKACSKTSYKAVGTVKKLQLLISKIFVVGLFKKLLLWMVRRYNNKDSDTLAHIFGRAKISNSFYPKEDFATQRYVPFEQVMLAAPCKVEDYLTLRFGAKYMQMPDEKTKALYQSHAMIWDVDKNYTEYVNK